MKLCLYKGPADTLSLKLGHWLTCIFTLSKYSHIELETEGVCYSSSIRDGGVRAKAVDLNSGKWDLFPIEGDEQKALAWFKEHNGENYDWTGVAGLFLRFIPKQPNHWFCSEAVAAALGMDHPERFTPQGLVDACM